MFREGLGNLIQALQEVRICLTQAWKIKYFPIFNVFADNSVDEELSISDDLQHSSSKATEAEAERIRKEEIVRQQATSPSTSRLLSIGQIAILMARAVGRRGTRRLKLVSKSFF